MMERIAIPSLGKLVNAHFGRSQAFTIYEVGGGKIISEDVLDTTGMEHQHQAIAEILKSKGVNTVICGGIGPGAINGLEYAGLSVLRGASGETITVATNYAEGKFVSTNDVCNHTHGEHQ